MNTNEIFTLIISIISIIISTAVAVVGYSINKKQAEKTLEADFFKEIYTKYLLKELPLKKQRMEINTDGDLIGTTEIKNTLNTLLKDSLYYKFNNPNYYEKLCEKKENIEDYIVSSEGRKIEGERKLAFYNKIDNLFEQLYQCMRNQYLGL